MKQLILPIFIIANVLIISVNAFSQHVQFTYDNAGNRVKREIIYPKITPDTTHNQTAQNDSLKLDKPQKFTDFFGNGTVTVYPNPTLGVLQVDFTGQMPEGEINLFVFDMAGRTVLNQKVQTNSSIVNISKAKPGEYILKITGGGKTLEWGIVKQ